MTQTLAMTGFNQESFDHLMASRDEPAWLQDQRKAAWDVFCQQDLPHQKEEEWIRTDIRLFKLDKFGIPAESNGASATPLLSEGVVLGGEASSVNGVSGGVTLQQKWIDKGVVYCTLEEDAQKHGDLLQKYLHTHPDMIL